MLYLYIISKSISFYIYFFTKLWKNWHKFWRKYKKFWQKLLKLYLFLGSNIISISWKNQNFHKILWKFFIFSSLHAMCNDVEYDNKLKVVLLIQDSIDNFCAFYYLGGLLYRLCPRPTNGSKECRFYICCSW